MFIVDNKHSPHSDVITWLMKNVPESDYQINVQWPSEFMLVDISDQNFKTLFALKWS